MKGHVVAIGWVGAWGVPSSKNDRKGLDSEAFTSLLRCAKACSTRMSKQQLRQSINMKQARKDRRNNDNRTGPPHDTCNTRYHTDTRINANQKLHPKCERSVNRYPCFSRDTRAVVNPILAVTDDHDDIHKGAGVCHEQEKPRIHAELRSRSRGLDIGRRIRVRIHLTSPSGFLVEPGAVDTENLRVVIDSEVGTPRVEQLSREPSRTYIPIFLTASRRRRKDLRETHC